MANKKSTSNLISILKTLSQAPPSKNDIVWFRKELREWFLSITGLHFLD